MPQGVVWLLESRGRVASRLRTCTSQRAGSCTVTVSSWDRNFNAAQPATTTINIVKGNQTITFDPLPKSTFGDPRSFSTARASTLLPVSFEATGSCTVESGGAVAPGLSGTCTVTRRPSGRRELQPGRNAPDDRARESAPDNPARNAAPDGVQSSWHHRACSSPSARRARRERPQHSQRRDLHVTGTGTCTVTATEAGDGDLHAAVPAT